MNHKKLSLFLSVLLIAIIGVGFKLSSDNIIFGDGTATDKEIIANIGNGSTNPRFQFDATAGAWKFSNDGAAFQAIGSGGGGVGVNVLDNEGFELGTNNWTASGSSVFAQETSAGNVGLGDASGSWNASATSENLTSDQQIVPGILQGQKCVAGIYYKGGDETLRFEAINGSLVVQGFTYLQTQSDFAEASFEFDCPSSGTIALRILSESDAPVVYLDAAFLGGRDQFREAFNYVVNPDAKFSGQHGVTAAASGFTVSKGTTITTFSDSYFILTGNATTNKTVDWSLKSIFKKDNGISAFFNGRFKLTLDGGSTGEYKVGIHDGTSYINGTEADLIDGEQVAPKGLFLIDDSETYTVRVECTANCDADDIIHIDDLKISTTPEGSELTNTKWKQYTPGNTQGFGTISADNLEWKQVGDSIFIRGWFTTGTVAGTEAQIELPNSWAIGGSTPDTATALIGSARHDQNTRVPFTVLGTRGDTYLNFSYTYSDDTINPTVPKTGSSSFASTTRLLLWAGPIPIQELEGQGVTNLLTDSIVGSNARFSTGIASTSIAFSGFTKPNFQNSVTEGGMVFDSGAGTVTVPSDGIYLLTNAIEGSFGTGATVVNAYWCDAPDCSGTIYNNANHSSSVTSANPSSSRTVELSKGDVLYLTYDANGSSNSSVGFGDWRDNASITKIAEISAGQPVRFGIPGSESEAGLNYPTRIEDLSSSLSNRTTAGTDTYTIGGLITGRAYTISTNALFRRDADASAASMTIYEGGSPKVYAGLFESGSIAEEPDRAGISGVYNFVYNGSDAITVNVTVVGTARVESPSLQLIEHGVGYLTTDFTATP